MEKKQFDCFDFSSLTLEFTVLQYQNLQKNWESGDITLGNLISFWTVITDLHLAEPFMKEVLYKN